MVLDLPAGPGFVEAVVRAWEDGDAVFPLDPRLPDPAARAVVQAMAPSLLRDAHGDHMLSGARPVEPGDAVVVATSGTSGQPKGVVLTHDAIAASAAATSARIGVRHDDHWLACLPLAHIGGLSVVMRALWSAVPVTVTAGFDPVAVASSSATLVSLVPTTLGRVDPTQFRVIVLGGARPPSQRPANVVTTYGMTETGSGVVYDGVPLDGVEVRVDSDGGILLRGPMLLRAYRDGTDPTDPHGWLDTGDVGTWDHGRLAVQGRRGDMINTGGEKVWPDAVEAALADLPGAAEVAIAGCDDSEWGQVVVAFVVLAPGADAPTLAHARDLVKATLPSYCAPRRLVVVDALPRTSLGKVRRSALAAAS